MLGLRFGSPLWLLALALVPLVVWHGRRSLAGLGAARRWTSLGLRAILVAATALALAEAYWRQESREVTTVYLVDRSDSLARADQDRAFDYVRATADRRSTDGPKPDDCAGLVVFARGASVELAPSERFRAPERLHSSIETGHTDIAEGLRLASASFPAGARKRVALISDGVETRGMALEEARRLAELGVRVEVLPVARQRSPEVLVERLAVRPEARAGEPVEVRAVIRALQPASGTLRLFLDGREVGARRFAAREAGKLAPESFELRLPGPGFYPLEARLDPDAGCDTVPQNNVGYAFTQVRGEAKVLILFSPEGKKEPMIDVESLARALAAEKIEVKFAGPDAVPASAAELASYDCVIAANFPSYYFTPAAMEALRAAVREMGVGLVMIGGMDSFSASGYRGTPIEEALPVTCDVRQRKVMPNGALVLIMHTCEMPDPNYWGKRISDAAIDALSDLDECGLIYYGFPGGCSWLFRLQKVGPARGQMHALIKGASPGDMPDFDSSLKLAIQGLQGAAAALKHVIIISDGDPQFADPTLLPKAVAAKITVSTVAIAPHDPSCTGALQKIAASTGGRFYYPKNPNLLPQIFVKEAQTVRRSSVFVEPFTPKRAYDTPPIKGFQGVAFPQLGGYVVTTPKDRAEVPLTVQLKDVEDPILAHWQYGEGKAVAFTSTAAPDWAREWIAWNGYGKFWSQVVRWASRAGASSELAAAAEVKSGTGKVIVEAIDDKGRLLNFLDLAAHAVDPRQQGQSFALVQTAPGRYEGDFEAGPPGAYSINVVYKDASGQIRHQAIGAASGYSPEFAQFEANPALLADIARATGGRVLSGDPKLDRPVLWARDLPPGYRVHPGWKWLLWLALLLFPLDVAIRRVMIDWREVRLALRALLGLVFPRLRPAPAEGPDPTMAALMAEKDRIRRAAPAPTSEDVRARFLSQLAQARAEEEAAAGGQSPRPRVAIGKEGKEKVSDTFSSTFSSRRPAPPAEGISSYTAALLEAKKRALKARQSQTDEDRKKG